MHDSYYFPTACLLCMHSWFCHNGLALNSTKSESILIGTRQRLRTLPPIVSPTIAGIPIPFSETIKALWDTLDQNLTLNKHVSSLSRNIHFYTRALRLLDLPWRSLWLQVWVHLWCNPGWIMPTPLCIDCQHLSCTNYSLPNILSLVWFCLLFAMFQQVSDSITSIGFSFTTEYSLKSLHLSVVSPVKCCWVFNTIVI